MEGPYLTDGCYLTFLFQLQVSEKSKISLKMGITLGTSLLSGHQNPSGIMVYKINFSMKESCYHCFIPSKDCVWLIMKSLNEIKMEK